MAKYADVVFMQSPEDGPAREWLDNAWQGDDDALVDYLANWDDADRPVLDALPAGTDDDTFRHGAYIVSYNRRLDYVGLVRVIAP